MRDLHDRRGWELPYIGVDRLVVMAAHLPAPHGGRRIAGVFAAALVPRWIADGPSRRVMMDLFAALSAPRLDDLPGWCDQQVAANVVPLLQHAFRDGRLVAYERRSTRGGPGHAPPSQPRPAGPPAPKPKKSKPKKPKLGPPRITLVRLVAVTFQSDHGVLKSNDETWLDTGELFDKPEWTPNHRHPVSHSMELHVSLTVELDIGPPEGTPAIGRLIGAGPDGVRFRSKPVLFQPGSMPIALTSETRLTRKIQQLHFDVSWQVEWQSGDPSVSTTPTTSSNLMFVTWGTPIVWPQDLVVELPQRQGGATLKRMRRAVERVAPIAKLEPHAIVEQLFARVPGYTLESNPAVPEDYYHPHYFNDHAGPWPLTDYESYLAECQAIVRMVLALIHQLGIPGDGGAVVVWADPNIAGGNKPLEAPQGAGGLYNVERKRNGVVEKAALLDGEPIIDKREDNLTGPRKNQFEACLRFDYGPTHYYAGGVGKLDDLEQVIRVFWGLVWYVDAPGGTKDDYIVTEIVPTQWQRGGSA